ncbi:MAG TPA: hypothetical protein VM925_11510 [Labilithrix sp.]|nr:hypothetical protein [Labilithrix sp.]
MNQRLFFALSMLAAFAAACSTTKTTTTHASPDAGSSVDPNAPAEGTEEGEGGEEGRSQPGATKRTKTGTITLAQTVSVYGSQTYYNAYASAYFVAPDPDATAGTASTCTTSTVAGCTVLDCPGSGGSTGKDAGAVKTPPNAGAITITGGALPSGGLSLTPTGVNGTYEAETLKELAFEDGDELVVSAKGADVPAFAGKSVHGPSNITVTAPAFNQQFQTSVDRSKDLNVAWTGTSAGDVTIGITSSRQNGRFVQVECKASAASGTASVPSEALSKLEVPDGKSIFGSISITPSAAVTFEAGEFDVTFRVQGSGKTGTFTAK